MSRPLLAAVKHPDHGVMVAGMSELNATQGVLPEAVDANATRWRRGLAVTSLIVLVAGSFVAALVWTIASAELGAAILSAVFTLTVGVLVVRQAILAERD